ncbi:DUF58 domain-containing protein [Hydrogenophaga aquatica]
MNGPAHAPPPRQGWRSRWQNWWLSRLPRADSLELTQHNIYILPTRAGWMLALTLLLLLVGSINYQLNLGYLLTFLLAGCAAAGMHVSHRNVRGLRMHVLAGDSVFAGQAATAEIVLHNPSRRHRYGLSLRWRADPETEVFADVPAQADEKVELRCPTHRRGRMPLPDIEIECRFPMGAFRVWSWWRPRSDILVFPAPEAHAPPLPLGADAQSGAPLGMVNSPRGDEANGLRPYRRGDPLRWVVWKKVARHAGPPGSGWISRDFEAPATAELWLNHAECGIQDLEGQLARLCAWVNQAEALGLNYGLTLPGEVIPPDRGPAHLRRCLEAMACC